MRDDSFSQRRRGYLTALVSAAGFGGCLGLEESQPTPTGTATGTRSGTETPRAGQETDTGGSTTDDSEPESRDEQPSESPPPGTRWTVDAGGPFIAGPVHVDGTVVATSIDRNVYGVDAATGETEWAAATETALENGLAVVDGTAVAVGIEEQVGVDISDGTTTYQHVGFPRGVREQAAGDGVVYQCRFNNGGIRAITPATGEVAWSDRTTVQADGEDHGSVVSIAHDGETVCVGAQPDNQFGSPPWAFAGYDVDTGERLWYLERDLDFDSVSPEVAVSNGTCLAHSGDNHYMILDARTGSIRTESETSYFAVYGAVDGTVVLLRDGTVHGADIATIETRWQSDISPAQQTLDGATFWVTDDDATLYRIDVPSGEVSEVQQLEIGGSSLTGELAVTDETVFVTTEDATLRALERR